MNPYDVLGVRRGAGHEEIRRAYLALARRHHPDRGGDAATMQRINEAWAALRAPAGRAPRTWAAPAARPAGPGTGPAEPAEPERADPDLFDDRPLAPPRRSPFDAAPIGLFAVAVIAVCLALALDAPALLAVGGFLFFLSCLGVAAVALLAMRRSVRVDRR